MVGCPAICATNSAVGAIVLVVCRKAPIFFKEGLSAAWNTVVARPLEARELEWNNKSTEVGIVAAHGPKNATK